MSADPCRYGHQDIEAVPCEQVPFNCMASPGEGARRNATMVFCVRTLFARRISGHAKSGGAACTLRSGVLNVHHAASQCS